MKQTSLKQILAVLLLQLSLTASAQTPWKCDGRVIGTWSASEGASISTNLYTASFTPSGNVSYVNKPATANIGLNAIGFRKQDGFVYGIRYESSNANALIRIDSAGTMTNLGNISNMTGDAYYAGAVDVNGYLYVTRNSSPYTLYKVDVTTKTATSIGGTGRTFVDIAFDPLTNTLYGVSGATLYTIDINSGASTQVGSSYTGTMFGLFFTDGAELYGFHTSNVNSSSTPTTYYKINKATGTRTAAGSGPQATRADACSCPFRLSHTMKSKSNCMLAGQDSVFTIAITNITSSTQNATYDLTMDKRFSFTETAAQIQANIQAAFPGSSAVVTITSANGGTNNVISVNSISVPVTDPTPASFKLAWKAKATGFTSGEQILFQSVIDVPGNTLSLGADFSDDPLTAQLDDATTLTICVPTGGPLPVSITDFKGQLDQKNANLNWVTQQELNTQKFDVEKSFDGVNFSKVASVPAKPNTGIAMSYQYTDINVAGGSIVYYRLKAIDNDGNFRYSPVIILKVNATLGQTTIYPTAFTGRISVNTGVAVNSKVTISLSDAVGKKVAEKTTLINTGNNTITLDGLSQLQQGFYFVKIYNGEQLLETKRVIKLQ
ncbi:DUF6923 family protein [Ferruginibacter sp. SUN002]|uniref:DUF6923 family protein n=1 Tax=Ferruginibacter sp. SUN002 TaxID=2937789 RepID=UPI003D370018